MTSSRFCLKNGAKKKGGTSNACPLNKMRFHALYVSAAYMRILGKVEFSRLFT